MGRWCYDTVGSEKKEEVVVNEVYVCMYKCCGEWVLKWLKQLKRRGERNNKREEEEEEEKREPDLID